jgi:hypothetical protein
MERRDDASAALGHSLQDRDRGCIDVRHAAKVKFEVGRV